MYVQLTKTCFVFVVYKKKKGNAEIFDFEPVEKLTGCRYLDVMGHVGEQVVSFLASGPQLYCFGSVSQL